VSFEQGLLFLLCARLHLLPALPKIIDSLFDLVLVLGLGFSERLAVFF